MREIKCAELILDFDFYPRHDVDSQHVAEMCEAERAGVEFPPVVYETKSKRVVDGFHRVRKQMRIYGDDATIAAVAKKYRNEREMFLDAIRYNAHHGRRLNSWDRTHCLIIGEKLGLTHEALSGALGITNKKIEDMTMTNTASVGSANGVSVALKRSCRNMAGRKLTKRQVETLPKLGGSPQLYYVNQLIMLIETNMLDRENEKLMERLGVLKKLI